MSEGPGTNTGHGYVWKRPDGMQAKCGGPSICLQCARDFGSWGSHNPVVDTVSELLSHFGVNQGALIEMGFAAFMATVAKDCPPSDAPRLRQVYFAGAQHLFASIMQILDPGEDATEADLARMGAIASELEAWADSERRRWADQKEQRQ